MTAQAQSACEALVDAGIPMANQAVLLRGVNDCARVQAELSRALLRARVRPYYLMQCDAVQGTAHLRVSTRRGVAIMAALRGWISGLGIPAYVLDLPGGAGKVPLGPAHVENREGDVLFLRGPRGETVRYADPLSAAPRCSECTCPGSDADPGELTDWGTPAGGCEGST